MILFMNLLLKTSTPINMNCRCTLATKLNRVKSDSKISQNTKLWLQNNICKLLS